jgi:hypothetical protein
MWGERSLRAATAALVGGAVMLAMPAMPAGAATRVITVQTRFTRGGTLAYLQDGACPDKHIDGDPNEPVVEEYNEVQAGSQAHGDDTIGLSICWAASSALGGDFVDFGTFSYATGTGSLKGTVRGSEAYNPGDPFDFTLTITSAGGDLTGTTGMMTYVGCQPASGQLLAKLRTKPRPHAPTPRLPAGCAV